MSPIAEVVLPLKNDAIARAEKFALEQIERVREDLKANDNDINAVAPYPSSKLNQFEFTSKLTKYNLYNAVTMTDKDRYSSHRPNDPRYVIIDDRRAALHVEHAKLNAAAQYEAFVLKLITKVGPVKAAKLEGNHVWSFSLLRVTKLDDTIETWKTQTIINVSKLGTVFNQWPTRKLNETAPS